MESGPYVSIVFNGQAQVPSKHLVGVRIPLDTPGESDAYLAVRIRHSRYGRVAESG